MNGIIHLLTHVLMQYLPFVYFTIVLVKQVGLPIPAIPFLIAAGMLVGAGHMLLGVVVGLAVLGGLLGNQFWYKLGHWPDRSETHPGSATSVPPSARVVGLRMRQYFLYHGVGTILLVGSAIGLGYAFSGLLDTAVSMVAHLGPMAALILLGIVAGHSIYKTLRCFGIGRLISKLTVQQVTKQISTGEALRVIDLRSQGVRQDDPTIPGSLALAMVSRPGIRSRRRRNPV